MKLFGNHKEFYKFKAWEILIQSEAMGSSIYLSNFTKDVPFEGRPQTSFFPEKNSLEQMSQ